MKKIEIDLTEEQYQKMMAEMERGSRLNLNEETFSGYEIKLSVVEGGFAWVDFKMYNEVDLGDVNWRIV